jgi:hypothetical protein
MYKWALLLAVRYSMIFRFFKPIIIACIRYYPLLACDSTIGLDSFATSMLNPILLVPSLSIGVTSRYPLG